MGVQITFLEKAIPLHGNTNNMKKLIIALSIGVYVCATTSSAFALSNQTQVDAGLQYLKSQQKADGSIDGFSGVTDWTTMAFSASGVDTAMVKTPTGQSLMQYLQANPPTTFLSANDWARRILAVTATEQNPYDFTGLDLVSGLKINYVNNQLGSITAVNDDVFGLLALLSAKESVSSTIVTDTTSFILSHQHTDGGFSYSTDTTITSDIDDTAAAIMALVAARNQGVAISSLQSAIDNAKEYILAHQNSDGGFAYDPNPATSWDTSSNVSTTSWVVMALSSLGMANDANFTKAQAYLIATQQSDGSFPYQSVFPPGDTFDTSYAVIALTGSFWPIHTFAGSVPNATQSSAFIPSPTPTSTPTPTPTPTLIVIANTTNNSPTSISILTESPTPTIQIAQKYAAQKKIIEEDPDVVSVKSAKGEVLGENTNVAVQGKQTASMPLAAKIFFSLGIFFLLLFIGKIGLMSYQ